MNEGGGAYRKMSYSSTPIESCFVSAGSINQKRTSRFTVETHASACAPGVAAMFLWEVRVASAVAFLPFD